jgi:carboxylate-amine ligase
LIEQNFGRSLTVGVEDELWILDAETLQLEPAVEVLVAGASGRSLPGALKTELHASVVELATETSESADEAIERLVELRRAAREIAQRNGYDVAASGSYPTSIPSARRQGVSGLHVHVGMPDAKAAFRVMETIIPWLPVVLALSANSPYFEGRDTGMLSIRAEVLGLLPRHGAPPAFRDYAEWERFIGRMAESGVASDYTSFWWDIRLHPRFGTLEIRAPDEATSIQSAAALVRYVCALCEWALDAPPREFDPSERGVYDQNRWAASRFGPHGKLIHPDRNVALTVAELASELPIPLDGLDPRSCEADRQLEVGRAKGLRAVCADLVERSVP